LGGNIFSYSAVPLNVDGTSISLIKAKVASGKVLVTRKDGYEISLYLQAFGQYPMLVLFGKPRYVYCRDNPSGLCVWVDWYDA